ncbi:hypothetical protein [Ideonella sp. A 288]|uniref:hypothetical protein n=1 Tax=Ideonella sp. A 288 TaxID=1962181 RepID=UPI000B4AC756|nr:hypothetical protein [Ideonella sp. A 288]
MELIRNGYFETGELDPWQPCMGMALEGGGVSEDNPVFLSAFNLRLIENDCVRQPLPYHGVATDGGLALWLMVHHVEGACGRFEARIEYSDGGDRSVGSVTHETLHDRPHPSYPYHLRVAVDPDRYVSAVQLRCVDAAVAWYVCAVSMEGRYLFPNDGPMMRAQLSLLDRVARMEHKLARMERSMTTALSTLPRSKRPSKA